MAIHGVACDVLFSGTKTGRYQWNEELKTRNVPFQIFGFCGHLWDRAVTQAFLSPFANNAKMEVFGGKC